MHKLVLAIATMVAALGGIGAADAAGVTPDQLTAAGWSCFRDPANPRINCSDPGHGRPVISDPSPPPSYNFMAFTLEGTFMGTIHLIRADLYSGAPCPQTGTPYFFIPAIGYYRCEHF
jgi:hypothetical protein